MALDPRAVRDPEHIRVLASPIRHELVDTLAALGGRATVGSLAEHLGRPADGLYYHLELLGAAGLVCESLDDANERCFSLEAPAGVPLRLAYDARDDDATSALKAYVKGLLQVAEKDFSSALERSDVEVGGRRRELWAARNKGWLSDDDVVEANALLERLCELMSRPRDTSRTRLMSFAFVLAPAPARGKRRSARRS
ncbi:winged helix-turn-helix domain-containing protein [Lysobacter sp. HA18]